MNAGATARSIVETARDRNITFLAASVAHYAVVSLIPLFIIALTVVSFFDGNAVVAFLTTRLDVTLSELGLTVLRQTLRGASGRVGAGLLGVVVLLWSSSRVFQGLTQAFDRVYDADRGSDLVEQVRDGALVLGLMILSIVVMVAAGIAVTLLDLPLTYPRLTGAVALFVALTLVFLPMYYVLPPVPVEVREILPGTLFAAVGWTLLQYGFLYYVQHASRYQAYGALGGVLLLVTWLYFGGVIVLFGAVVNVVLDRRTPLAKLRAPR
jgi:membrane protein